MKFEASIRNLRERIIPMVEDNIRATERRCEEHRAANEHLALLKADREAFLAELAALEEIVADHAAFEGRVRKPGIKKPSTDQRWM